MTRAFSILRLIGRTTIYTYTRAGILIPLCNSGRVYARQGFLFNSRRSAGSLRKKCGRLECSWVILLFADIYAFRRMLQKKTIERINVLNVRMLRIWLVQFVSYFFLPSMTAELFAIYCYKLFVRLIWFKRDIVCVYLFLCTECFDVRHGYISR